ncbi:MAG: hypothetical protein AAGD92_06575 [Pseudomonadota bacterium]
MNDKNLKRSEKLQLLLDEEELKAIDDWRFAHRLPSRAAALRELLRRGLLSSQHAKEPEMENQTTGEFRVVDSTVKAVLHDNAIKKLGK